LLWTSGEDQQPAEDLCGHVAFSTGNSFLFCKVISSMMA
jgi:hypothetical protein